MFTKKDFGKDFLWGVAQASYQTEGAWNTDGKSPSVWDVFSHKKGKIERNENGDIATDFFHKYKEDIQLVKSMNFDAFRFSLSWPRILPDGIGTVNQKGIDFYNNIIDECIKNDIQPWITIYHWDHPQILEDKGGWTNREMLDWFSEYCETVSKAFGGRVKNWMILNEPFSFTVNGYFTGDMAPGKKGLNNLLKAVHNANLCQAEGGRIVRRNVADANIGTTQFMAYIEPFRPQDESAALKFDALINRIFLEPSLGLGYPTDSWKYLKKIEKYIQEGDIERMKFDFDFIGLQYYFRLIIKKSAFMPYIHAIEVKPAKRMVKMNEMDCEVYPQGLFHLLNKLSSYEGIKKIHVTENGVCYKDILENEQINDTQRIEFFENHLEQILKAKNSGINVDGYFVWSLTDNFEWDKGFRPRFGLVYVDFKNNYKRFIKNSGLWFKNFLQK